VEQQRKLGRNVNQVFGDVHIVINKLVDFTTPTQYVETFGQGRLHIAVYLGTLNEMGATTPLGRVYVNMARFYQADTVPVGGADPFASDDSFAVPANEEAIP
jgi:hypothetical protein